MVCSTKCSLQEQRVDKCMNQSRAGKCRKQNLQEKAWRKSMNSLFKVRFCKGAQRAPQIHGSGTLKQKISAWTAPLLCSLQPQWHKTRLIQKKTLQKQSLIFITITSYLGKVDVRVKSFSKAVLLLTHADDTYIHRKKKKTVLKFSWELYKTELQQVQDNCWLYKRLCHPQPLLSCSFIQYNIQDRQLLDRLETLPLHLQ